MQNLIGLTISSAPACERVVQYLPGDALFTPHQHARGFLIRNLKSQLWTNQYLDGLARVVCEELRGSPYANCTSNGRRQ